MIPKSATPSRISSNIDIFDFELTAEDVKRIDKLDRNFRFLALKQDHKYYPFSIPF